jgi:hypothetical protein
MVFRKNFLASHLWAKNAELFQTLHLLVHYEYGGKMTYIQCHLACKKDSCSILFFF